MTRSLRSVVDQLATIDDIASLLVNSGIRGERFQCNTCPVAEFVQQQTGCRWVQVTTDYVSVDFGSAEMYSLDLPENVADFIEEFDDGWYPQLDTHRSTELVL